MKMRKRRKNWRCWNSTRIWRTAPRRVLRTLSARCKKIDEGTYGVSDASGELIPIERLDAVPEAIYTLEEQQARDPS